MRLLSKKLPKDHNLFLFGDCHVGSLTFHEKSFLAFCDLIESEFDGIPPENNFAIDHGDGIEGIMIDDRRFHPDNYYDADKIPAPVKEADYYCDLLRPISPKILFMLDGNHFHKLWRFGNLAESIAQRLGIFYGGWTTKLTVRYLNNKLMYKSYHTHGWKPIRSYADDIKKRKSNEALILKRHLQDAAGDTILMCKGHVHKLIVSRPAQRLFMTDDGVTLKQNYTKDMYKSSWIHPDHRWYICTGSFRKSQTVGGDVYSEIRELPPIELGFAVVKVRDGLIQDVLKMIWHNNSFMPAPP